MKKGLFLGLMVCLLLIVAYLNLSYGTDTTKRAGWYNDKGFTLGEEMIMGIDSSSALNYKIYGVELTTKLDNWWIDSLGISVHSKAGDTSWNAVAVIPYKYQFIVDSMWYGCRIEPNMSGSKGMRLTVMYYDSSASATDTLVLAKQIDADSIASNNSRLLLTFNSTTASDTFNSGDIIWAQIAWDSTITTIGKGMFLLTKGRMIVQ